MGAQTVNITPTTGTDPSAPLEGTQVEQVGDDGKTMRATVSTEVNPSVSENNNNSEGGGGEDKSGGEGESKVETQEPADKPAQQEVPTTKEATEKVEAAGFTMEALAEEYAKNGKLSDETYTKLGEKGFPKEVVDSYIAGQQALQEKYVGALAETVGGQQQLDDLLGWAAGALSEQEIEAANAALGSMNEAQAKLVLQGLQARYEQEVGRDPGLIRGGTVVPGGGGIQPFSSNYEMTEAMADPKYKTDPAYREKVMRRLALSNF